jgi:nitrite reductase/ring-hydroxylating ferredoxin subunit
VKSSSARCTAGRFSVRTGKGLGPPIPCDLKTYLVRVIDDEIQVRVADVF